MPIPPTPLHEPDADADSTDRVPSRPPPLPVGAATASRPPPPLPPGALRSMAPPAVSSATRSSLPPPVPPGAVRSIGQVNVPSTTLAPPPLMTVAVGPPAASSATGSASPAPDPGEPARNATASSSAARTSLLPRSLDAAVWADPSAFAAPDAPTALVTTGGASARPSRPVVDAPPVPPRAAPARSTAVIVARTLAAGLVVAAAIHTVAVVMQLRARDRDRAADAATRTALVPPSTAQTACPAVAENVAPATPPTVASATTPGSQPLATPAEVPAAMPAAVHTPARRAVHLPPTPPAAALRTARARVLERTRACGDHHARTATLTVHFAGATGLPTSAHATGASLDHAPARVRTCLEHAAQGLTLPHFAHADYAATYALHLH